MDMVNKARMIVQDLVPDDTMTMVERRMKSVTPRLMKGVKALAAKLTRGIKNNRVSKKKI